MRIESSAFFHNGLIPSRYTCDGENISPPLTISEIPDKTQSLVLIMEDPDVPRTVRPDGMWDHWVVWNIHPLITAIAEGADMAKDALVGKNTGGALGYGGPCPPDREHRYFFKIYALDTILDVPADSTKADVIRAMEGHIINSAELMGRYARTK